MMVKNRIIGRRYDGGKSPLGGPFPDPADLSKDLWGHYEDPFGHHKTRENPKVSSTKSILGEYRRRMSEKPNGGTDVTHWTERDPPLADLPRRSWSGPSDTVPRGALGDAGKDPRNIPQGDIGRYSPALSLAQNLLDRENARQYASWPTTSAAKRLVDNAQPDWPGAKERTKLHEELMPWATGPLKIERVASSWFHHMMDYDSSNFGTIVTDWTASGNPQLLVVEQDWASTNIPDGGEWRLPFKLTAWEMQISGVRVIAVVECDRDGSNPLMILMYGKHKLWVIDDYRLESNGDSMVPEKNDLDQKNPKMFWPVYKFVWDNIRASCILVDARVAKHETVQVPRALIDSRVRSGKSKPKDYLVVRLLRTTHTRPTSGNHFTSSGGRSPQRGHWRKGTWVHYDDPDSGQVQYANDGGFIVSKTWRRWHFAGDPNNLIRKEYRV